MLVEQDSGGLNPEGDAYVWTTPDGIDWRGGRFTGAGPWSSITVHAVDDVLYAATTTGPTDPDSFYLLQADGTDLVEVPDTALPIGIGYGQPVAVGDDAIVVAHADEGRSKVLRLHP